MNSDLDRSPALADSPNRIGRFRVRLLLALALAAVVTVGLAGRMRTWPAVFFDDQVFLAPGDSYYHARLARLSALSFPAPVRFDPYACYPGMEPHWPPGHSWLLAALLQGGEPFSPEGLGRLAWAGPLLSLLGAGLLLGLAWRRLGAWAALALAGALLVTPAAMLVGELGEADHHVHELFFCALTALLLVIGLQAERKRVGWAVATGAAAGVAHFFTSSGWLILPVLAAGGLLADALARERRWERARLLAWAGLAASTLLAVELVYLGRLMAIDYVRLSGFHLALSLGLTLACSAPVAWARRRRPGGRAYLALAGACGLGLGLLGPGLLGQLGPMLAHLGHASLITAQADEATGLLAGGLARALESTGWSLLAWPLLLALGIGGLRRGSAAWPALLSAVVICMLASLVQERFSRQLTGFLGVAAALAAAEHLARSATGWRRPVAAALTALLLLPLPASLRPVTRPHPTQTLLRSSLDFLARHTPPTRGLWDPTVRPEYAVLAPWVAGHALITLAQRPAVATPFGLTEEAEQALAFALRFFSANDVERAADEARARGVRYVLALPWPGGLTELEALTQGGFADGPPLIERLRAGELGSGSLRQIFVSAETFDGQPAARLYELVPTQAQADLGLPDSASPGRP